MTNDAARRGTLGDPVIRLVQPLGHHHALDLRIARRGDHAVRDEPHLRPVARGDAVALVLHRTGISVDIECDRRGPGHAGFRFPVSGLFAQAGREFSARLNAIIEIRRGS